MKFGRRSLIALTLVLPFATWADTAVKLPAHVKAELGQARLAGYGTFRWLGLKIYDAQFWVGDKGYLSGAPGAARFALDLQYSRRLLGKKIAESSVNEMQKLNLGTPEQRAVWRNRMDNLFPDVQEGTQITGIYLPNQGARFYRDGVGLGEIMDADFGRAFFAIWLDEKTSAGSLREALLADAAPR